MTPECWADPFSTNPQFYTDLTPPYTQEGLSCNVSNNNGMIASTGITVGFGGQKEGWFCEIDAYGLPTQCGTGIVAVHTNLTQAQFEACLCDLEAYTTQLNQVNGISVSGGPQFKCTSDLRCQRPPAPIPTISEMGMIAMAGVLGIIGFIVIRRKKVAA